VARIERSISTWEKATAAFSRSPQIGRCVGTFTNWRQIVRVYAGGEMPNGFTAYGRNGFAIPLKDPTDVQTTWVVFCTGDYFVPYGSATVLDLGANIGAFSVYASRCRGAHRIYAVEPVAATFAILQTNIEANGLTNVQLVRKGIAARSGRRTIHLGTTSQHASLIHRGDPQYESGNTENVDVVTLEDLFRELRLDEIDMVKMDCEGGEVEAILAASDATLRRIKHLSLEYHYPGNISNDAEFFGRLARAGFRCTRQSRIARMAQFVRE
jgi:FkbM family methyltransferase